MKGLITYVDIGHGFKSPSIAVQKELLKCGITTDLIDFLHVLKEPFLDKMLKNSWKFLLKYPFLFDVIFTITNNNLFKIIQRNSLHRLKKKIEEQLITEKPDFILSTCPYSTDIYTEIITKENLPIAIFAYNSDALFSHMAYISKKVDKYFVPTKQCFDQMSKQGQPIKSLELSSFPIDLKFKKKFESVKKERHNLGLKNKFTLLIMIGSDAQGINKKLPELIIKASLDIQIIVVCGKNLKLKSYLDMIKMKNPKYDLIVEGFVSNMQDLMYVSNVISGKAGLNFTFETIFMKKPFIVLKAMINEKYAARFIVNNKIGWWPKKDYEFINLVKKLQSNNKLINTAIQNIQKINIRYETKEIAYAIKNTCNNYKNKKIKKRKNLFFDLGGTLCDIPIHDNWNKVNLNGIVKVLNNIDLSKEDINKLAIEFVEEKSKQREKSKTTLKEFEIKNQIKNYFDKKGLHFSKENLISFEKEFISTELEIAYLFENTTKILNNLSKKYDLYILSNNVSSILVHKLLETHNIKKYFKKIFVSADIGFRKPHKKFIDHVLKTLKLKAKDCIMIGDRLNQDIKLTDKLNMASIFVSITKHPDNIIKEKAKANFKVKSLNELESILIT